MTPPITVDEAIKRLVAQTLVAAGYNMTKAARSLDVDRRTLYRWVARYGFRKAPEPRPVASQGLMLETVRHYAENPPSIEEKA